MDSYNKSLLDNIQFQFSISKQLLNYHLKTLNQEEYMWRSPNSGLYLKNEDGVWKAELPETESYDLGTPSIAWTLWHITYWWEMVFDYSFSEGRLTLNEVIVYEDVASVKKHLHYLTEKWEEKLANLSSEELLSKTLTKFPFENQVEFHKLASWLNLELMKNASEIGYARFDYASSKK
ncbi:DinB family protein [Bacillus horti]|uniref:DinB-like domain-containing protein n=1 Tax=Caldalkalibacillus horti TaxID=77523 RepID=A0ABT9W169_9BACI|nr:DinB family protein [Bacillus horti]MDQ0167008.1 hypothetical protein [Bacillus horti]